MLCTGSGSGLAVKTHLAQQHVLEREHRARVVQRRQRLKRLEEVRERGLVVALLRVQRARLRVDVRLRFRVSGLHASKEYKDAVLQPRSFGCSAPDCVSMSACALRAPATSGSLSTVCCTSAPYANRSIQRSAAVSV